MIKGSGFTGATAVRFDDTNAAGFHVDSDTRVTAVVASGTATGPIVVAAPAGDLTSKKPFVIVPAPQPKVKSFSPSTGPPGTVVTVTGKGFTGTTAVDFLDAPADSVSVLSDKKLTAVVAPGTLTGKIRVTTAGGTAASPASFVTAQQPEPGAGESFRFGPGMTTPSEDEIEGDVAYAVRGEAAVLGTTVSALATFASTDIPWLAEQQCAFGGFGGDCVSQLEQYWSTTAAAADPGTVFLNWSMPDWSQGAGNTEKIIAHETFHDLQYALDHLPNAPNDQVWPAGPVWLHEGAPEMVGYLVASERLLFPSYATELKLEIEQAKKISTPLDQLETYDQAQIPGVYSLFMVAVDHLVAVVPDGVHALIAYLDDLGEGMVWQDAFAQAFGMTVSDYYASFAAYRAKL